MKMLKGFITTIVLCYFIFGHIASASVFTDSFSVESQSSWGSNWRPLARDERFSISGGKGVVSHDSPGSAEIGLVRFQEITNSEASVQIGFKKTPDSGYVDASISLRQYYFRIRYSETSLRLVIEHRSDGTVDQIANIPLDLDRSSRSYSLRAIVTGRDKVRIAAQVWQEGQIPPSGWIVDMIDESLLNKVETGSAGLKTSHGSQSEGDSVVVFDNYSIIRCSDSLCGLPPMNPVLDIQLYKCPINTEIRGTGHPFWNSYMCIGQITDQSSCSTVTFFRDRYIFTDYECEPL